MTADIGGPLTALDGGMSYGARLHTYLNGQNHAVQIKFSCNYKWAGPSRLSESCQSDYHRFENSYDLAPNGKIAVSQQWISPEIGAVLIERLN